ncbi:MAG: RHS repeat-associated core domain-containing protein, partial [Desulfuromonadales bacterium]|nr:RHS repeat-associated core domain-containing protein [Desulfuromonadales bacterium]
YIDNLYDTYNDGTSNNYIYAGNTRIAMHWKNLIESGTLYYHTDHLGSTSVVTDQTGNKVEDIAYYPFGEKRRDTADDGGTANVAHKYTAQEWDSETELYDYNARFYDPETGRFITPDSIVPDPSDPQSLNRYAYARDNPILYIDPSGHWFGLDDLCAAVIGGIVGGITAAVQGGSIWQGSLIGAAAGYIGWNTFGTGDYAIANMLGGSVAGNIVAGAAAGAAIGATSAAVYDTDIGEGAEFGAIGGAVFGGIGSYWGNNWDLYRVGATTVAGGTLSAAEGGDWETGALYAFGTSASAYAYNAMLKYNPDPGPGENIPGGEYNAKVNGGRPPQGANVFGLNKPLTGDFWADFFKQGGALSKVANYVPGLNAVAAIHDFWMNNMTFNWATNAGTMVLAAPLTYSALAIQITPTTIQMMNRRR